MRRQRKNRAKTLSTSYLSIRGNRKNKFHASYYYRSGKQYMISNKETMEKLDGIAEETSKFLTDNFNRLPRASLASVF